MPHEAKCPEDTSLCFPADSFFPFLFLLQKTSWITYIFMYRYVPKLLLFGICIPIDSSSDVFIILVCMQRGEKGIGWEEFTTCTGKEMSSKSR